MLYPAGYSTAAMKNIVHEYQKAYNIIAGKYLAVILGFKISDLNVSYVLRVLGIQILPYI